MKMLFGLVCLLAAATLQAQEVKLRVVDELGVPVEGADAVISHAKILSNTSKTSKGKTDSRGMFAADGKAETGVFCEASKEGYYLNRIYHYGALTNNQFALMMPRKLNPIPLYALKLSTGEYSRGVLIPEHDKWVGFDLLEGEWVQPHGNGKTVDILFRFTREFKGYQQRVGNIDDSINRSKEAFAARKQDWTLLKFQESAGKWDFSLEIKFPQSKEGITKASRFLKYCILKLPHSAPQEGYLPSHSIALNNYGPGSQEDDVGYFVRSRVKMNESGVITAANFSKIQGGFQVYNTGLIVFTYYFNSTANDQNLEFDPKRNLFPKAKLGTDVQEP